MAKKKGTKKKKKNRCPLSQIPGFPRVQASHQRIPLTFSIPLNSNTLASHPILTHSPLTQDNYL